EGGETAVGALGISVSVKSLWGFGGVSVGNEAVMPVCIALLTESSNWSVLRLNSAILLWAITPNSAWSSVKLMATNYLIPQDNKKQWKESSPNATVLLSTEVGTVAGIDFNAFPLSNKQRHHYLGSRFNNRRLGSSSGRIALHAGVCFCNLKNYASG
ncbi:MAG: hypothetical protein RLZZ568_811, partial [Cyanobacteriota bacterium]